MRVFLYVLGAIVLVSVITITALPYFVATDTVRDMVVTSVRNSTGRTLAINGDTSFTFFPGIGVNARQVSLSSAPDFGSAPFATLDRMDIQLGLVSLLTGTIAIEKIVLVNPKFNLAVDKSGRNNWSFSKPGTGDTSTGEGGVNNVRIGLFDISGGEVNYTNAQSGSVERFTAINLKFAMNDLSQPMNATGSFIWNKEKIDITTTLASPALLNAGSKANLKIKISTPKMFGAFNGAISGKSHAELNGELTLKAASLRALATWLKNPISPGRGLKSLEMTSNITTKTDTVILKKATILLDGMQATGQATVLMAGSRPAINASFKVDKLDLNKYVAPHNDNKNSKSQRWSNRKIDFSGIRTVDGTLKLSARSVIFGKVHTGAGTLNLRMKDGLITADLTELALYKGTARIKIELDSKGPDPKLKASGQIDNIDALTLFGDAAQYRKIAGQTSVQFNVTSTGTSQQAIMSGLNGNASLKIANGAILGIDIANILHQVQKGITQGWAKGGKTPFNAITATYNFRQGIATNRNFKVDGPQVRITGGGKINMPARTLGYRVNPSLVGRGGITVMGINVPIIISGPWANPQIYPDLPDFLENPAMALKSLKVIGETGAKGVGGLVDTIIPSNNSGTAATPIEKGIKAPFKAFKKLF